MKNFEEHALFELRFWLQVLGDHCRFIHDSLAPEKEADRIRKASQLMKAFDELLQQVRKPLTKSQILNVSKEVQKFSSILKEFKLSMVKAHLIGNIHITLSPSFMNHMVNELVEAQRVLSYLMKGEPVANVHPLHHDLIWLLDAAGHAGAINDNLDRVEKDLKNRSNEITKKWEDFYLKAVELVGYLRANVTTFPALSRFHKKIELEMAVFKSFLRELEEMELNKESLGTLTPLMADHMAREECYYLMKLAETTKDVNNPRCDPTKPRTE